MRYRSQNQLIKVSANAIQLYAKTSLTGARIFTKLFNSTTNDIHKQLSAVWFITKRASKFPRVYLAFCDRGFLAAGISDWLAAIAINGG